MTTVETVVSEKVVKHLNPISQKLTDIQQAFKGIGCGVLALIIGLGITYYSVVGVKENSKTVGNLVLQTPADAKDTSGLVKISGIPNITKEEFFSYSKCANTGCTIDAEELIQVTDLVYYEAIFERFEVIEEKRTEVRPVVKDGVEVEETVDITEYKEQWVEKYAKSKWSEFNLGDIAINAQKAKVDANFKTEEIPNVFIKDVVPVKKFKQHESSAEVGNTRVRLEYLTKEENLIVIGDINNNKVEGGETFIISNKTDAELISSLHSEEQLQRYIMMFVAWALLAFGFAAVIAPIIEFVEMIPLFGNMAKSAAGLLGVILAAVIVVFEVMLIKYWFVCVGGLVLILIVGVMVLVKAFGKEKSGVPNNTTK